MYYTIKFSTLENFLQSYQSDLCSHTFGQNSPGQGMFDINDELPKNFSEIFPYPTRLIMAEQKYFELSDLVEVHHEEHDRHLQLIVTDDRQSAIGVKIYKTSPELPANITFNGNVSAGPSVTGFEALIIAGFLATFPGSKVPTDINNIDDNFQELPYSARRFLIENILLAQKPSEGFFFLDNIGYLKNIMPEVTAGKNLSQNKFHKYDIFEHLVRSCDAMEVPDLVLRFSSLLHDIGKVPTRKLKENGEATFYNHEIISSHLLVPVMKRFGIPKATGIKVKYYVRNHMFHYTDEWSDKAVRRFLRKVTREDLENLILLRKSDRLGSGKKDPFPRKLQQLIDHIDEVIMKDLEMKVTDLEIGGKDLMEMGLAEGPKIGKILNQLLNEVKNEEIPNSRDILLEKARLLLTEEPRKIFT